jgi:dihydrofolate synthase/folylpolyglutamate synthase
MSPKSSSTDIKELLSYLYGLRRLGIKTGLRHTRELLACCGNPETQFRSIHISGTNGKGSVAAMSASILQAAGMKVGLYTSPHLIRFNERIRINGIPIEDEWIGEFMQTYRDPVERIQTTFFETTTALAFSCFAAENVDIAVIETGLGGRLDSTNVLEPAITAITPVSLDHRDILGDKLEVIAAEKAGIIKVRTPLVLGPQEPEVLAVLETTAQKQSAPLLTVDQPQFKKVDVTEQGTTFIFNGSRYEIPLLGYHQAVNAGMAIQIINGTVPGLRREVVQQGLRSVNWPGRLQQLHAQPPIFYDVAHNAHGLRIVIRTLQRIYGKAPVILLVLKGDKELGLIASELDRHSGGLIISGAEHRGLMDSQTLGLELSRLMKKDFQEVAVFDLAMEILVEKAAELGTCGLITGSHYVAEDIFDRFDFSFQNGRI